MKKIFIGLAVMAALIFSVAPSMALNSMPDLVPGTNPLLPFFVVEKAGFSSDTGLDTLFVVQEIAGGGTKGKTKGYLHTVIRDYKSNEVANTTFPYTPNDVVAWSVRDLLKNYAPASSLSGLEASLAGKTVYTGYVDFENSLKTADNLVSFIYVIDLDNGWAAATTGPVFEEATDSGYAAVQQSSYVSDVYGTYTLEAFSANALATTGVREKGDYCSSYVEAGQFNMYPRYFLKDANADTFLAIWADSNKKVGTAYTYRITCLLYDNDENVLSVPINIPYEVNWLDIRDLLPTTGAWSEVTGGWLDIPFHQNASQYDGDDQWLGYSYQTASSGSADVNWSTLYGVHREANSLEVE